MNVFSLIPDGVSPGIRVPLLMSLSMANQLASLRQLRAEVKPLRQWWPHGPGPYLVGGLAGVPLGLSILQSLPRLALEAIFGGLLVLYALYWLFKPEGLHIQTRDRGQTASLVGFIGGVIGGFTAFPGAAVVVWSGLRHLSKGESRAIVQPYILGLQLLSLTLLALQTPEIFSRTYWQLLLVTVPIVLPCTLLGRERSRTSGKCSHWDTVPRGTDSFEADNHERDTRLSVYREAAPVSSGSAGQSSSRRSAGRG